MNSFFTEDKGITLLIAVISIIVLLVIAGVSIAGIMNGDVLNRTKEGSKEYSRNTKIDDIKVDLLSVQKKNNGKMPENDFYETVAKYGTISERNLDSGYLTTTEGNFKIDLIELFDGEFAEQIPDDEPEEEPDEPDDPGIGGGQPGTTPTGEQKGTFARYYPNVGDYGNVLVISNIGSYDFSKVTNRDNSLTNLYAELAAATTYSNLINGAFAYDGYYPWQSYDIQYVITIGTGIKFPTLKAFFRGCKGLFYIDLAGCDFSTCTDASYMFAYTERLKVDHFNVDMTAVKDMSFMFSGNKNDTLSLINKIDTKNATTIKGMFNDCSNLKGNKKGYRKIGNQYVEETYLDLTHFNVKNVIEPDGFKNLVQGCNLLTNIGINTSWKNNYKFSNADSNRNYYLWILYLYEGFVYQYEESTNYLISISDYQRF